MTEGNYYASPVEANGQIYIPSGRGMVSVIKSGESLQILVQNDLKEDILASPAIIGNKNYVRTEGYLYAFGD